MFVKRLRGPRQRLVFQTCAGRRGWKRYDPHFFLETQPASFHSALFGRKGCFYPWAHNYTFVGSLLQLPCVKSLVSCFRLSRDSQWERLNFLG